MDGWSVSLTVCQSFVLVGVTMMENGTIIEDPESFYYSSFVLVRAVMIRNGTIIEDPEIFSVSLSLSL